MRLNETPGRLNAKQLELLAALLAGEKIETAATRLTIARATAYRWQADAHFQEQMDAQLLKNFEKSMRVVLQGTNTALRTALGLMQDVTQPGSVRIAAVRFWIEQANVLYDRHGMEAMLDELNEKIEEEMKGYRHGIRAV